MMARSWRRKTDALVPPPWRQRMRGADSGGLTDMADGVVLCLMGECGHLDLLTADDRDLYMRRPIDCKKVVPAHCRGRNGGVTSVRMCSGDAPEGSTATTNLMLG